MYAKTHSGKRYESFRYFAEREDAAAHEEKTQATVLQLLSTIFEEVEQLKKSCSSALSVRTDLKRLFEEVCESGFFERCCQLLAAPKPPRPFVKLFTGLLSSCLSIPFESFDDEIQEVPLLVYFVSERHRSYVDIQWTHREARLGAALFTGLIALIASTDVEYDGRIASCQILMRTLEWFPPHRVVARSAGIFTASGHGSTLMKGILGLLERNRIEDIAVLTRLVRYVLLLGVGNKMGDDLPASLLLFALTSKMACLEERRCPCELCEIHRRIRRRCKERLSDIPGATEQLLSIPIALVDAGLVGFMEGVAAVLQHHMTRDLDACAGPLEDLAVIYTLITLDGCKTSGPILGSQSLTAALVGLGDAAPDGKALRLRESLLVGLLQAEDGEREEVFSHHHLSWSLWLDDLSGRVDVASDEEIDRMARVLAALLFLLPSSMKSRSMTVRELRQSPLISMAGLPVERFATSLKVIEKLVEKKLRGQRENLTARFDLAASIAFAELSGIHFIATYVPENRQRFVPLPVFSAGCLVTCANELLGSFKIETESRRDRCIIAERLLARAIARLEKASAIVRPADIASLLANQ